MTLPISVGILTLISPFVAVLCIVIFGVFGVAFIHLCEEIEKWAWRLSSK